MTAFLLGGTILAIIVKKARRICIRGIKIRMPIIRPNIKSIFRKKDKISDYEDKLKQINEKLKGI